MGRTLAGLVTSNSGNKTIVITATVRKTHPLYKKQYSVKTKYMAHDELNEARVGDRVMITEIRPLSARKHFKLLKIIERGGIRFEQSDATADIVEQETPASQPTKHKGGKS